MKNIPEAINKFSQQLKYIMLAPGSINNSEKKLWNLENFQNLHLAVNSNLKIGQDSFLKKIKEQLAEADQANTNLSSEKKDDLLPLMIEILSLYYVFPSNISANTKKEAIKELINSGNANQDLSEIKLDNFKLSLDATDAGGIGSGGMGYNTNKQKEIFYLIDVFKSWYEQTPSPSPDYFAQDDNRLAFQNFLDTVAEGRSPQTRHVLLYLFFPDYYEPIISSTQKWKIIQVFADFCPEEELEDELKSEELHQTIDQKIKIISKNLSKVRENQETDFYKKDLASFWDSGTESVIKNLDSELLEYKKQVVLYGPPGTSKTYTANLLAEEIIRYRMAKDKGAAILQSEGQQLLNKAITENIHRLQLHPAYSYEDFIRGLQLANGDTTYKKGFLLNLIDKMDAASELPHVLILDEINRVDLSRLFGECFSAIENRGQAITLLGSNEGETTTLQIPDNLYIIGTMNMIDHSVEQLDFALRRRFLWIEASYNSDALLNICKHKWNELKWEGQNFTWEIVENDFLNLVKASDKLNKVIHEEKELGEDFVLGHVFFAEAVQFLYQFLQPYSRNPNSFLFTKNGSWREPIEKLWRLSLYPLLKEYLAGLDYTSQAQILQKLKEAFRP